jgi:hypothetical protein
VLLIAKDAPMRTCCFGNENGDVVVDGTQILILFISLFFFIQKNIQKKI